jgi:hypothetical protein
MDGADVVHEHVVKLTGSFVLGAVKHCPAAREAKASSHEGVELKILLLCHTSAP